MPFEDIISKISVLSKVDPKDIRNIINLFVSLTLEFEAGTNIVIAGWELNKLDENTIAIMQAVDDLTISKILITEMEGAEYL